MLRVERVGKRLKSFAGLRPRSLEEFYELGDFIANSPEEFFGELGESVLLVASGAHVGGKPSCYVDALAVDEKGCVLVVLIVPADEARPLERAMTAASQVSAMGADGLSAAVGSSKAREIRAFLGAQRAALNRTQRVLLLSENFDDGLLATAGWLSRGYGVDLSCVRVTLAQDPATGEEFLRCEPVAAQAPVPAADIVHARPRPAPEPAAPQPAPAEPFAQPPSGDALAPDRQSESSFPTSDDAAPVGPLPDNLFDPAVEELATAVAPSAPSAPSEDKRTAARGAEFADAAVEVQYAGRAMAAGLIDYSGDGIGVTLHSPLPVGAEVRVRGRMRSEGAEVEVSRAGRVVHCSFVDRVFRLGIVFVDDGTANS